MTVSRKLLGFALAGVVASAGAGVVVGQSLRSPADEAALRKPPKASQITVPVVKQKLTSVVTASGVLKYGSPRSLTLAGAVGGTAGGQRVTRAPRKGQIKEGAAFMEVNGRPVFALTGKVPMHRALVPGARGADVRQLQKALKGFGAPRTGVFDQGTAAAVRRWYAKRGYKAQEPDLTSRETLDRLRQAVQQAKESLATDQASLDSAADVSPLKNKLDNAKTDLREAEGALEKAAELDILPDDAARMEELRKAVRLGQEEVAAARQALAAAKPEDDKSLLQLKVSNAEENLTSASNALSDYSERAAENLEKRLEELRKAVRLAQEAMLTAEQALKQARATSPLKLKIAHAHTNVASAQANLSEYLSSYGVSVPAGELVFLPKFPARLNKVFVKTGGMVEDKVGTVTASSFTITGAVTYEESGLLKVGMPVTFEDIDGTTYDGVLAKAGEDFVVTPESSTGLKRILETNVTVRIAVGATSGEVLTVPVAAIVTGADGTPRVNVETSADQVRAVKVRTGLTASGTVEVSAPDLKEGDRVVVGNG